MAENKNGMRLGDGVADDLKQSVNQELSDIVIITEKKFINVTKVKSMDGLINQVKKRHQKNKFHAPLHCYFERKLLVL